MSLGHLPGAHAADCPVGKRLAKQQRAKSTRRGTASSPARAAPRRATAR
jgi:hypothetical protein